MRGKDGGCGTGWSKRVMAGKENSSEWKCKDNRKIQREVCITLEWRKEVRRHEGKETKGVY